MKNLIILLFTVLYASAFIARIDNLKKENDQLRNNQEVLLIEKKSAIAESQRYKVSDSLNAVKISELQLSLSDYKKYRKQDLELIKQLKISKSDLQKVISSQSETAVSIVTQLKDSIQDNTSSIKCFDYRSTWTDISGCVNADTVDIRISNRESLKIVETVEYKRFLGFLWKTNKIKNRQIDVVSENPFTTISNIDYISIKP